MLKSIVGIGMARACPDHVPVFEVTDAWCIRGLRDLRMMAVIQRKLLNPLLFKKAVWI